MSCKNLFDWENRLTGDTCAIAKKENDNKEILSYTTYNFYGDCENSKLQKLALDCPNLHFKNGYGFTNACTVDTDSAVRFSTQTHGPEKRQLNTRNFYAVPNMSRGTVNADTESFLLNAQDTTIIRECNRTAETNYDRFTPMIDCIQDHVRGYSEERPMGLDSREAMRKQMRSCQ